MDLLCCTSRGRCTVAAQSKCQFHACIVLKTNSCKRPINLSYLILTCNLRGLHVASIFSLYTCKSPLESRIIVTGDFISNVIPTVIIIVVPHIRSSNQRSCQGIWVWSVSVVIIPRTPGIYVGWARPVKNVHGEVTDGLVVIAGISVT